MLFALATATVAAQLSPPLVPAPRVALIYSDYGNYRHRDDYDARMKALGWPMDKYENTQFAELAAALDRYDIVLGSALFNYSHEQDFSAYWPALEKFLRRGGALVLTDVNYDQHIRWLPKCLGDRFAVRIEKCGARGKILSVSPDAGALTSLPYRWAPRATWAHMQTGSGWRVLASCADGGVVWAITDVGRGFIWLSSFWPLSREQLVDLWDYVRFRRAGVELLDVRGITDLRPGDCHLAARLRLLDRSLTDAELRWRLLPESGQPLSGSAAIRPDRRGIASLAIPLRLTARGRYFSWLALVRGANVVCCSTPVAVEIPPLVEARLLVLPRRTIWLSVPSRRLRFSVAAHPFGESLDDVVVRLRALSAGRIAANAELRDLSATPREWTVDLHNLSPGPLRVHAVAEKAGRRLWSRSWELTVVDKRVPQVALGPHQEAYVNGRLFFPIGIYHINPKFYDRAKAMGFNCVQVWGTTVDGARTNLDRAAAHGLMAVLEMTSLLRNKYRPDKFREVVRACRDHPALLAWYPVDEPGPSQLEWCLDAYDICRREDPNHPVYLVMCVPSRFAQFAPATDILAIDPYPIPFASVSMVSGWMKVARQATSGCQPIWLIPQLHNIAAYRDPSKGRAPTPDELWCMVVQGLIYGAKGVIYYPWDDGPCGLTHEPALMAEIPRINKFLAQWGPDLAVCDPQIIADGEGAGDLPDGLHAAVFRGHRCLLLATNTTAAAISTDLPLPDTDGRAQQARSLLTGRAVPLRDGAVHITLPPLGVDLIELR